MQVWKGSPFNSWSEGMLVTLSLVMCFAGSGESRWQGFRRMPKPGTSLPLGSVGIGNQGSLVG